MGVTRLLNGSRTKSVRLVAVLAAGVLTAAACSSSNKHAAGNTSGTTGSSGGAASGSPIQVGVEWSSTLSSALEQIGGSNNLAQAAAVNGSDQIAAMTAWVNAHGGLGGHKVVGVPVNYNTANTRAQVDANICTVGFQQHHLSFFAPTIGFDDNEPSCIKQNGAVFLGGQFSVADYQKFSPNAYSPEAPPTDYEMATLAHEIAANGWKNPSYKVAVMGDNQPDTEAAIKSVLLPDLAADGVKVLDTEYVQIPEDPVATAAAVAQTPSVILKWKSLGIDHLIFANNGYYLDPFFVPTALAQNFKPAYAFFGAPLQPGLITTDKDYKNGGLNPLNGALVVSATNIAGTPPPLTSADQTCADMYKEEGLAVPLPLPGAVVGEAYVICDAFLFLDAAFAHGALAGNPQSFKTAVGKIGTLNLADTSEPLTFSSSFPYSGVTQVADFTLNVASNGYTQAGPWHAIQTK